MPGACYWVLGCSPREGYPDRVPFSLKVGVLGWVPAHPHQEDRKKKWSTCKESGTKIQSLQKNLHGGPSYPIIIIGFIIIMGCVVYFGYHYYTSHSGGGGEGEGSTGGSSGSTTENVKDKPSWL